MDHFLVVIRSTEVPNFIFVHTVINTWYVGVGRICVQILTLSVRRDEFLISILSRNNGCGAHIASFLWHSRLQTLKIVCLEQINRINVCMVVRVILDVLVEAGEGIVEDVLVALGVN